MLRSARSLGAAVVAALVCLSAAPAGAQTLSRGPLIQNPAALTTTMTIVWWTDVAGDSTVEYGTTPALGSSVTVAQAASCEIGSAGTCHTVELVGLQPGTKYWYRLLTNGTQVLGTEYFTTLRAPNDPAGVFFTVIGDWGQSGSSANVTFGTLQTAADPPLVLTVGDNAYPNGTQSDWDNNAFVSSYRNGILRRALFMPVLGNHDLNSVGASSWQSSVEIKMHALPRNAPAGQEERFFSFDHGDVHFVALDANPPAINATQTNWLAADLAATTRKWVFVFLHQTPYSCANGLAAIGSDLTVRNTWGPLFEQYGVDVVFVGHDHLWEKSKLVDDYLVNGSAGSDGLGTYYIMTGGGGAALDGNANVDGGGPYRQPLFGSKTYCPWLADDCPNGAGGQYCSIDQFQYADVRIVDNTTLTVKAIGTGNDVIDTFTLTKGAVCGNGTVESGEQCDQGAANGTASSCCTSGCQFTSPGTQCRAAAGACDVAESCSGASGTCPADGVASAATVCRAAGGDCDVAETCTGSSASCPADALVGAGSECRAAAGACDVAEQCTGSSIACPADAKSAALCRGAAGVCDQPESCDGVGDDCPADGFVAGGTQCRAATGLCDVAETCTGSSAACPADGVAGAGSTCRASAGVCDPAESCDGATKSCPADGFASAATVCRPAAGTCDAAETCTGGSAACPVDAKSTAVCRAVTGACDVAETCDGASNDCPPDVLAASGTTCRAAAGACDVAETCDGATAACPADAFEASTTVCRPSAGACDAAEQCTGGSATCPADVFQSSAAVCRPSAGVCDAAEQCTGSAAACPADVKSIAVCRPAAGVCDAAESCDGTGDACPADALAPSTTVCRGAFGVCDVAETCTGSSVTCPADGFAPATTVCRAAAGVCDVADFCTGGGPACSTDAKSSAVCRVAAGPCDVAESCNGLVNTCPLDGFAAGGTPCRAAAGACDVVESCSGFAAACPADAVAALGTPCRAAAGPCDVAESCPGDATTCPADVKSTAVCRPAAGPCDVAESCTGTADTCPADQLASSAVECRPAASSCDVAEFCTGGSTACPADAGQPDADLDGVCDASDDCPGDPDPAQGDGDGDGRGDACDPCTNTVPVAIGKAKVVVAKPALPGGDDRLRFSGFMLVPAAPPIDPSTRGLRVLLQDTAGGTPLDVSLPGGPYLVSTRAGWSRNASGTTWSYRNSGSVLPLVGGIVKAVVKGTTATPGLLKFRIVGKTGTYPVPANALPVKATVVVDVPNATTGQCGEATFPGPAAPTPTCSFNAAGTVLKCR